jgi:threonine dehydratase
MRCLWPLAAAGCVSGVANYIKAVRPDIKVIGVQMNDSDAMIQSVKAGARHAGRCGPVLRRHRRQAGGRGNLPHRRGLVDEFMTVDTDAVCAAIKDVFVDTRSIVEPAGALAVAAIKQYVATHKTKGETYAAILCGANMNFDRLRFVAERAEVGEEREALFAVTIPEERGSFRASAN